MDINHSVVLLVAVGTGACRGSFMVGVAGGRGAMCDLFQYHTHKKEAQQQKIVCMIPLSAHL